MNTVNRIKHLYRASLLILASTLITLTVGGAIFEGSNAIGINGNQADNTASNAGAVYLY